MNKLVVIICAMMLSTTAVFAQNYNTGDTELNASLTITNSEANKNLSLFKQNLIVDFGTTLPKIEACFKIGMTAGDVRLAFEIGKIARLPIERVQTVYKTSSKKGWGAMAKELGIKPGSPEFHQLKGNCKKNANKKNEKVAVKSNGNSGKSNGNSGKSNGNGNGKGKK